MIVNGKAVAIKIEHDLITRARSLEQKPRLSIISVGENHVSERFVRMKTEYAARIGVHTDVIQLPEADETQEVIEEIKKQSVHADGIIVQLPLPRSCDTNAVLASIAREKDVDALSPNPIVLSPVVGAVQRILAEGGVSLTHKKILVIGRGRLVGAPLTAWLSENGNTVEVIGDEVEDVSLHTHSADVIISGAGEPHLIKPSMIKEGVVLIDCGTSEAGGKVIGDADPACASKCTLFTPVPGGVGPVTVAMLFENLFTLIDSAHK